MYIYIYNKQHRLIYIYIYIIKSIQDCDYGSRIRIQGLMNALT